VAAEYKVPHPDEIWTANQILLKYHLLQKRRVQDFEYLRATVQTGVALAFGAKKS
jgi:hypothetical protein